MREIAASRLFDQGIEVGAAASPFPIPLHCSVEYADICPQTTIKDILYPGQNFHNLIKPTLITDLEKLEGIEDNSLDFIVACHVIEYVSNVLLALENAYNKLRVGDYLSTTFRCLNL
ncbi:hypothetical protein NIES2098_54000 [Calothrix sp. NIES-2098]|nr:hypothetical protein NIES2098_54000 [Calothrix sp. NIES-2098]